MFVVFSRVVQRGDASSFSCCLLWCASLIRNQMEQSMCWSCVGVAKLVRGQWRAHCFTTPYQVHIRRITQIRRQFWYDGKVCPRRWRYVPAVYSRTTVQAKPGNSPRGRKQNFADAAKCAATSAKDDTYSQQQQLEHSLWTAAPQWGQLSQRYYYHCCFFKDL